jgi:hypothetical protein
LVFSIAGAKKLAFFPSAKYSSQPDESTRFTRDLSRASHLRRCRE